MYTPPGTFDSEINRELVEGIWRADNPNTTLVPIRNLLRRSTLIAQEIRDEIAEYCSNEGHLQWQDNYA